MKKYIIPTIECLPAQFETPLCVGVSDTEYPTDPILAPKYPEEEEQTLKTKDFWKVDEK